MLQPTREAKWASAQRADSMRLQSGIIATLDSYELLLGLCGYVL